MVRNREFGDEDFARVYAFLSRLYQINKSQPFWLPTRWEYAEFLVSPLYMHRGFPDWRDTIRIWETDEGEIIGMVSSENPDENAFIHTDPEYRYIEEEMVLWAEENIAISEDNANTRRIIVWTLEGDYYRERILARLGYTKQDAFEYLKWQHLSNQMFDVELPTGYSVLSLSEGADLRQRIECAAKSFESSEVPIDVYRNMQKAPSYRPDLDLCIVRYDGTITSFCTVWVDKEDNIGYFEPVGTHPEYQRRGLGKAVVIEGLRRLKSLGVETAYVGAYGDDRSSFYSSAGFTELVSHRPWKKFL